ncbi:hypothetical protein [Aeromonas rivipollensis]|uniref:hypothetical protein n=1 Tax=Aeromonas rivipollensis TaxID=948519 RepID=UPI003D1D7C62
MATRRPVRLPMAPWNPPVPCAPCTKERPSRSVWAALPLQQLLFLGEVAAIEPGLGEPDVQAGMGGGLGNQLALQLLDLGGQQAFLVGQHAGLLKLSQGLGGGLIGDGAQLLHLSRQRGQVFAAGDLGRQL